MRIGYARVSTDLQTIDLQIDALRKAGCDRIFEDRGVSGIVSERPGLHGALTCLEAGDRLVVWRLDRLARSMRDLTDTIAALHARNIGFQSICEHIDVGSAFGEFVLHVLSAVAHFERALIIERTRAGMAAAKARGATFGRKPVLSPEELHEAVYLIGQGMSVTDTASQIGVGRSTLYRYLADRDRRPIRRAARRTAADLRAQQASALMDQRGNGRPRQPQQRI